MKRIMQFRYCGDGNSNNFPNSTSEVISAEELKFNNIFQGYNNISQLGIQGEPGTTFYLNNSQYSIVLGETGIYEIDLQDRGNIYAINFVANRVFDTYTSGKNQLLIDIIYDK